MMITLPNGSYCTDPLPKHVKVGNYSSIATGVMFHNRSDNHLAAKNHDCVYTFNWDQPPGDGEIVIGSDVWICAGVRILPDLKIGDGAIIGAGAVVVEDVDPYSVVVGNPGVVVRYRFDINQVEQLLRIKWWDWTDTDIQDRREDMKSIDLFLLKYA